MAAILQLDLHWFATSKHSTMPDRAFRENTKIPVIICKLMITQILIETEKKQKKVRSIDVTAPASWSG